MKILYLIILVFSGQFIFSQDGVIDLSFGDNGIIINSGAPSLEFAKAILVQPDHKILIAGGSGETLLVIRYNENGTPDSTFNYDGFLYLDDFILTADYFYQTMKLVLQDDGKIIISGFFKHPSGTGIKGGVRLFANGFVDGSFGIEGDPPDLDVGLTSGYQGYPQSIGLQSDGKIIVATSIGETTADTSWVRMLIIRYNPDGTVDNSFNSTGFILGDDPTTGSSVAVQDDDKILITGGEGTHLYRFNADGSPDLTFSDDGKVTVSAFGFQSHVILERYGFILVRFNNGPVEYIYRYDQDGNKIEQINEALETDFSCDPIALAPDGKFVIAGYQFPYEDAYPSVQRFYSDCEQDNSFGNESVVETHFDNDAYYSAVAVQEDGKIICAGRILAYHDGDFTYDMLIARYTGSVETGIVNNQTEFIPGIFPNPAQSNAILNYYLPENESVSIHLFDITGNIVLRIINEEFQLAGKHQQQLELNQKLPAGIYMLYLKAGAFTEVIKLEKI